MGITSFALPGPLANEAAREQAVVASRVLDATGDPSLQALVACTRLAFGTEVAAISIAFQDWQYFVAAAGMPTGVVSRRTSLCAHAILAADDLFCVLDTGRDPRFAANPAVIDTGPRFYAAVPLTTARGVPLGALCIFDRNPRDLFSAGERAELKRHGRKAEELIRALPPARHAGRTGPAAQ